MKVITFYHVHTFRQYAFNTCFTGSGRRPETQVLFHSQGCNNRRRGLGSHLYIHSLKA